MIHGLLLFLGIASLHDHERATRLPTLEQQLLLGRSGGNQDARSLPCIGRGSSDLTRIAMLAGYRSGGGGFRNALGALRTAGLIEGGNGQPIALTSAGELAAVDVPPLPSGPALIEHWKARFGKAERLTIEALVAEPAGLSIDELAAATGYAAGGGGFRNALGSLRTAGVLVGGNGQAMRLSDELLAAAGGTG